VYTQCSNCETIFKLSAEVLRAAGGQVRCGRCGEVFSALARLAEDAAAFKAPDNTLELEKRAERILESTLPRTKVLEKDEIDDSDAQIGEVAHLQVLDFDMDDLSEATGKHPIAPPREVKEPPKPPRTRSAPSGVPTQRKPPAPPGAPPAVPASRPEETSMEFTLPPGELDRIFIEAKRGVPPPFPAGSPAQGPTPEAAKGTPAVAPVAPNPFIPPKPVTAKTAKRREPPVAPPEPEPEDEGSLPDIEVVRDNRVSSSALAGGLISDTVRRQMLSPDPSEFDLGPKPTRGAPFALWLTGAIVAALLLAAQMVHHNREWLASHGPFAPLLRTLYTSLGAPVAAPANLSAYQLRQWGVTGDPAADGTLKVRASILNTTAQLEPYPLLRVTLANRYGNRIGQRDFEPSEYLGKPTARLLAPGERADATVQILDPGKDAEGFEIDVCLRGADKKILCANDVAAPQPKP
jgi:predicted Zn finger-like uncharacterized protein